MNHLKQQTDGQTDGKQKERAGPRLPGCELCGETRCVGKREGVLGLHKWGAGGCISDFSSIANLVPGLRQDYRLFIPVSITDDSSKSSFIDRFLSGQPPVKLFTSVLLYNPHSPIVHLHLTAEVIRSSERLHHSSQVALRSQGVLCLPPRGEELPSLFSMPHPRSWLDHVLCPAPSKTSGFPPSIPGTQRPGSSNQGEEG